MRSRAGHTLLELTVAMPLAALLLALLCAGLHSQLRLMRRLGDHVARTEAMRTTERVLREELRWDAAGDVRTDGQDSIRLRVFRGVALPCTANAAAAAWSGLRAPAARKDSLLLLDGGAEAVAAITSVSSDAACAGYRIVTGTAANLPALVFETGTYYLQDGALRYRTGGEGRQPLVEEWLAPSTRLALDSAAALATLTLVPRSLRGERSSPAAWLIPLDLPNAGAR